LFRLAPPRIPFAEHELVRLPAARDQAFHPDADEPKPGTLQIQPIE
jgi:hypothetical protein